VPGHSVLSTATDLQNVLGVRNDIITHSQWARLLLGLSLVFALFHGSALLLGSDRGQAGLIVGTLVLAATLAVECLLWGRTLAGAADKLGLGWPHWPGLAGAGGACVLLALTTLAFLRFSHSSAELIPGAIWLLPGLFAQGGIAEELLFRGYLFGHLRGGRTFWQAAALATLPFTSVHLILFLTMPWPVALAALILSVVLSFPLAYLFELGGASIRPPAILHCVIQGTVKVLTVSGEAASSFPLVWMAASAILPISVMLVPRTDKKA
jgi:membrane protease YdiL (CAAX protease family)